MTHAPIALTVHPGGGIPPSPKRELIARWLRANGINPDLTCADDAITILSLPYTSTNPADGEGPWFIKVIAFTECYATASGAREANLITGKPVTFQRTVPLQVPFPTAKDDGTSEVPAAPETQHVETETTR